MAGERKPRDRAILALLAYGGLRRGEVMAADVGDYAREAPSLMVHGKGNKDRVVPLHSTAQAALDAYLATRRGLGPEHPLFVSWRGRITHRAAEPPRRPARDPEAARPRVAGEPRRSTRT